MKRLAALGTFVAALLLGTGVASAAVPMPFFDGFDRPSGPMTSPWTNTNGWFVDNGQVKLTLNGFAETVVDTGLSDHYRVSAKITLSPNRANAGLTVQWKSTANHIFCKIEVTPGNPTGLMSIGHRLNGKTISLLKSAKGFGLTKGGTYLLTVTKAGQVITSSVSGAGIAGGMKTISYTLTAAETAAFGAATGAGLRGKNLYDEDDGQSRYDNFLVESI
jgi:hypothetical protein